MLSHAGSSRPLTSWRVALARRPRLLVALLLVLTLVGWTAGAYAAWLSYDLSSHLPGPDAVVQIDDMAQATTLLDRHDRPIFTIFKEQRIEMPLQQVSRHLIDAVVAIEDQRFFQHRGVDPLRIVAAAFANLREGRAAQGGSTISQQLARQSLLSRDKTLRRKVKEILLAAEIERRFSKPAILELYLNKVYFGDGLYGVEAAALGFLGKHAAELGVADAALLAGLIKSPSTYAPTVNLDRAVARRNVVLSAMLDAGAIDRATFETARRARVVLANGLRRDDRFGLYFREQVRRDLVERFGWRRVYQGGLRVYTTIDPPMQQAAEDLVERSIAQIERRRDFKHGRRGQSDEYLQGALVAIDVTSGHVLAMVGGRDFGDSSFNRAVQARRQPGSAFKPFVFAAALEAGYTPATLIQRLDDPIATLQGAWAPEDEHADQSAMTLRTALRRSSNRAAVHLLQSVGIHRAVDYARRLNVGTLPEVPSLALGSGEVTLISMTAAFGAFANGGLWQPSVFIRRVEDATGTVLYQAKDPPTRAMSDATAFLMSTMLADVINAGTAYRARASGFTLPAAGKTGTTNDFVDAWFIGFTPTIVAGVWVGFDRPQTIVREGYAADLAVPLWASFMKVATRGDKPAWFTPPPDVVAVNVCRVSGKLPADGCGDVEILVNSGAIERRSMVYTEYFARGTEPQDICPVHSVRSSFDTIAGTFGVPEPLVHSSDAGLPTSGTTPLSPATSAAPDAAAPIEAVSEDPAPPPPKKRGFWGRIFGVGKDEADKKKKPKP